MTALAPFAFRDHAVRVLGTPDAPLFVLADVCAVLGIADVRQVAERTPEADRCQVPVRSGDQRRQMWAVTEAGLYRVILRSDRPEAEPFMRWVTREVLPAIRRTGRYDQTPAFEIPQTYAQALALAARQAEEIERQQAALAEAAPKARSWDVLASGRGDWSVADAAKVLSRDPAIRIGRDRLYDRMHEAGWLFRSRSDGRWRARQTAVDAGRLTELPQTYTDRAGDVIVAAPQVRVTAKGMAALHRLLGGADALAIEAGVAA